MLKSIATIVALTTCGVAAAYGQSIPAGTYASQLQYTAVNDLSGLCSAWGITPNSTHTGAANVAGFSGAVSVTSTPVSGPTVTGALSTISCSLPALPAAAAFTSTGSSGYAATPSDAGVSTCSTPGGTLYQFSSNGTLNGYTQTKTVQILNAAVPSFQVTASNVALSPNTDGSNPFCYVDFSVVYTLTSPS